MNLLLLVESQCLLQPIDALLTILSLLCLIEVNLLACAAVTANRARILCRYVYWVSVDIFVGLRLVLNQEVPDGFSD